MRKSIRDPFYYNTIDRNDFWTAFVRAFTFRYDKYQENYTDMLDVVIDACYENKRIGNFMCYYDEADYFIHNMSNNVIVGWYKHFGRCNCVNIKGFTVNDLYQFFKELRMDCYNTGKYYHIATPEWKVEQEAAAKAEESRRNDPAYRKQLIEKVTRNSVYGVCCQPSQVMLKMMDNLKDHEKSKCVVQNMYPNILKTRKETKNNEQHS